MVLVVDGMGWADSRKNKSDLFYLDKLLGFLKRDEVMFVKSVHDINFIMRYSVHISLAIILLGKSVFISQRCLGVDPFSICNLVRSKGIDVVVLKNTTDRINFGKSLVYDFTPEMLIKLIENQSGS